LTTVRQPVYQVGHRAAQRLLDSLHTGEAVYGTEILPTQLIVRDSADCPVSHSSLEKEGISS
jgi:DNA-binding LacI/PurR family transcriptional regulator